MSIETQTIRRICKGVIPRQSTLTKANISLERFNEIRVQAGLYPTTLEYARSKSVLPPGRSE